MKPNGIAVLSLAAMLSFGLFGCAEGTQVAGPVEPTDESSEVVVVEATEEEEARQREAMHQQAIEDGLIELSAGQEGQASTGFAATIEGGDWASEVDKQTAEASSAFYVARGTVRNTGDTPIDVSDHVVATVSFGQDQSVEGTIRLPENSDGNTVLQPGDQTAVEIIVEAPEELKGVEGPYTVTLEIRDNENIDSVVNVLDITLN